MKKKRKLKIGRLLLICILLVLIIGLIVFGIKNIFDRNDKLEPFDIASLNINELDYSEMKELDLDLYSKSYMLVRLNDFKVLYGKNINHEFYPASLTKIVSLDTVITIFDNMEDTFSFSQEDYDELVSENASLAYLEVDKEYSIRDLLYAMVLPSGADAGRALENYFEYHGLNFVDEMNNLVKNLKLTDSHFTNSAGLHDNNLYTSLDDYCRIVINTLLNDEGKGVLKSFSYTLEDGTVVRSTLRALERDDEIKTYGGKTGFTGEAGENVMVLYTANNRSYILILANAPGNPYLGQNYHFADVNSIFEYLYN